MTSLRSGFRNRFNFSPVVSKRTDNFGSAFPYRLDLEFTPNFRNKSSLFYLFSICHFTLTVPSTHKKCLLFVTVAT